MDFSNWEISDYAAWWGAIIATLTLIWNIILALKKGPRIFVKAIPNMEIFPSDPLTENKQYISITAINKGSAPTTITHFCGYFVKNLWDFISRKRQNFIINAHPSTGKTLPYVLKPGEEWHNLADQKHIIENYKNGFIYVGVAHNQQKKPKYVRISLKSIKKDNNTE